MRNSDLDWLETIILSSGIGTRTQRKAIIQRIIDANSEARLRRRETEGAATESTKSKEPT